MRKLCYLPLFMLLLGLAGCNKDAGSSELKEERNPLIKTAQAYMDIQDWDNAEATLRQAVANEPDMARPHLMLATIYQQHKINPIYAIYHYDRYLQLSPNSEKKEFIQEQKMAVAQILASTLVNNSPDVKKLANELQSTRRENESLKRQLASLQKRTAPAPVSTPAPVAAPKPVPTVTEVIPKSAPATQLTHKIYHVEAGDNLTKIAQKFYGTGEWEPIFEANRDTLRSPGDLKVGQTLVIPNVGN